MFLHLCFVHVVQAGFALSFNMLATVNKNYALTASGNAKNNTLLSYLKFFKLYDKVGGFVTTASFVTLQYSSRAFIFRVNRIYFVSNFVQTIT